MSEQENKPIIVFDATELDNFDTCKQKWNLFHHRRIVPKTTKSYFETGTLLHYLLELYYTIKKERKINQDDLEQIIELGRIRSLDFSLELDEISEIIFQFREYHRYYEDENIAPLFIEQPFTVELFEDEDIKVLISGKPDLIFTYGNSKDKIVMDHKKVSRESEISQIRNQFLLYATAMKTDTVIVNKIGFQKTKKPSERFNRTPFIYHQDLLDEWKEDAIESAKLMYLHEKAQHFPRNRTSCEKWDGCFYRRYCTTRPKAREFLISNEYIIGEFWDPGKKLESEIQKLENENK